MFADTAEIQVSAGNGGAGLVSFRREKFVSMGGPDGGDGGNGGDVIFRASTSQNTLVNFRHKHKLAASGGMPGSKRNKHGRSGEDLTVDVPVGTLIYDKSGDRLIADLTKDGQEALVAKGGQGGFGNAHFKSSVRQAPQVAEKGTPGEVLTLKLELKLIADVGLVGLPNAGKSTLLSIISNAKPQIANYPFTTITPNLGVVDRQYGGYLVADIPGLIEGASKGKGLGHDFLRHVERTRVLIHLIDAWSNDVVKDYNVINTELNEYSTKLSGLKQLVILSKTDGLDQDMIDEKIAELKAVKTIDSPIFAISSVTGVGVQDVLTNVSQMLKDAPVLQPEPTLEPETPKATFGLTSEDYAEAWKVTKKRTKYLVTGPKIENFALKTNFGDFYAEERLQDIMSRFGIIHELDKLGYESGQTIIFGEPEVGRFSL